MTISFRETDFIKPKRGSLILSIVRQHCKFSILDSRSSILVEMHLLLTAWIILALLFLRLLISVFADVISPLRDVPGPFLSRLTSLWYFKEVAKGTFEKTNVNLHKRYGASRLALCLSTEIDIL